MSDTNLVSFHRYFPNSTKPWKKDSFYNEMDFITNIANTSIGSTVLGNLKQNKV